MASWISVLTIVHVVISLVAIALGVPAMGHLLIRQKMSLIAKCFFLFTALTTLTGFLFPITRFTPGIAFGILTLILLGLSWFAALRAASSSRWHFVFWLSALGTWYLNCFVLVVQAFQKIQPLHNLAPTQSEWPFAVAHLILAIAFSAMIWNAYRSFFLERLPVKEESID